MEKHKKSPLPPRTTTTSNTGSTRGGSNSTGSASTGTGRLRRRTVLTGTALCALAAGIAVATLSLPKQVQHIQAFTAPTTRTRPDHAGTNILVLGTDSRKNISPNEKKKFHLGGSACDCTDTLILLHVSAHHDRMAVVGLPRDSYARIPRHRDPATGKNHAAHSAKINAAFAEGGVPLTVRTVEKMTAVRIDHVVQIDFRRFMDTVDLLHGVEICTPRRLRDPFTGLDLTPGRHLLHGGQALQYVRARHVDPTSDFGRIQRQQRFLLAVQQRLRTRHTLRNPATAARLTRTLLGALHVDRGFTVHDLTALAGRLRTLRPAQTEFTTVPVGDSGARLPGGGTALRWQRPQATTLFTRLRTDRPLTRSAAAPRRPARSRPRLET